MKLLIIIFVIIFVNIFFYNCNDNTTNNDSNDYPLRIKYLIPDPESGQNEDQEIAIINISEKMLPEQKGWQLVNRQGYKWDINYSFMLKDEIGVLKWGTYWYFLDKYGDTLNLISPDKKIVQKIIYGSVKKGDTIKLDFLKTLK